MVKIKNNDVSKLVKRETEKIKACIANGDYDFAYESIDKMGELLSDMVRLYFELEDECLEIEQKYKKFLENEAD